MRLGWGGEWTLETVACQEQHKVLCHSGMPNPPGRTRESGNPDSWGQRAERPGRATTHPCTSAGVLCSMYLLQAWWVMLFNFLI